MNILLTGGTGFIGRHLVANLSASGHAVTVLSRDPATVAKICGSGVKAMASLDQWSPDLSYDAVINLAGAPIIGQRWSPARKQVLWDSRVALTNRLTDAMGRANCRPAVLISGSAIGIYGEGGDRLLDEGALGQDGFARDLCAAWEESALKARELGIRVCLLRTGLVIGAEGGFLSRMLMPFRLGLGGPIGDGRQWMSWIHLSDHVGLTRFLLESNELEGPFNATAPHPVTNSEFTRTLAWLLKRPAGLRVPASLLRLAAGEMSELLLGSQRVVPARAEAAGFRFAFDSLEPALRDVLKLP